MTDSIVSSSLRLPHRYGTTLRMPLMPLLPTMGLMLTAECAPDVPLQIIAAICEALEEI